MSYRRTVILSIFTSVFIFVLFYFDLIRKVPGFYCEGFGCIGNGIVMVLSPLLVAILFFVGGIIFVTQRRLKTAFIMAGIAFAFASLAVISTMTLNKLATNRAQQAACRENPAVYCPETLAQ